MLHVADVGLRHPRRQGKILLRDAATLPDLAQAFAEQDTLRLNFFRQRGTRHFLFRVIELTSWSSFTRCSIMGTNQSSNFKVSEILAAITASS